MIGRNGMGKSTLCAALTGLLAKADGSVRFGGRELMGMPAYRIAAAGIGFVPQGRRLFPSLSVEEHLKLVAGRGNGKRWTPKSDLRALPASRGAPQERRRRSSRAASSRCSRSRARSSSTPSC